MKAVLSGSQGEGCALRISGCRAVLSGSRGAGLCCQDLGVRAVLSGAQGTGLVGLGPSGTPVFISS